MHYIFIWMHTGLYFNKPITLITVFNHHDPISPARDWSTGCDAQGTCFLERGFWCAAGTDVFTHQFERYRIFLIGCECVLRNYSVPISLRPCKRRYIQFCCNVCGKYAPKAIIDVYFFCSGGGSKNITVKPLFCIINAQKIMEFFLFHQNNLTSTLVPC